jgi:signal transduction histidine kinase
MPRLSLATRLGLIVMLSLVVVWLGSIALRYMTRAQDGGDARPLPGQVTALVELLERTPADQQPLVLRAVASESFSAQLDTGLAIGPTERQRVALAASHALRRYLEPLGGRPVGVVVWHEPGQPPARTSFVRPVSMELRIGLATGQTLQVRARGVPLSTVLGLPLGFISGLFGTLVGLLALIAMHRETQPLARLAAAVDGMDPAAAAPVPLPPVRRGAPEIRALMAAFHRLQQRLALLLRARMAMLGGISHDVRSFATRLRLRVEHIADAGERERAVADIADMIRLLDDALLASRAGAGELAEELVELDKLVQAEVDDRRALGADVQWQAPPQPPHDASAAAWVLGDRLALRRVVANLIDNALEHGRCARVAVQAIGSDVVLTVDDRGPGIPPEQREAMLEPFVRLEGSRSRRTGGAGLGLAVVRSLVEAHRGRVGITDAPGGGARLTVHLPAFRA